MDIRQLKTYGSIVIISIILCFVFSCELFSTLEEDTTVVSVIYNANGADSGTVPVDSNEYELGSTIIILPNEGNLAREGYRFYYWNTSPDGSGKNYGVGERLFAGDSSITFYAQWTAVYNISYDPNGASSGTAPEDKTSYQSGDNVSVLGNSGDLAKTGYVFTGWNTMADGTATLYSENDTIVISDSSIIFYAQWRACGVFYNGNGATSGSVPLDSKGYKEGDIISVIGNTGNLVKTDFVFMGWAQDSKGSGTYYHALNEAVMGTVDIIFYAQWKKYDSFGIGSQGPAGGIIFYDYGRTADEMSFRYLEVAPKLCSEGTVWGSPEVDVPGTLCGVGAGQANTIAIVNTLGVDNYAAKLADELELNGYNDWFLPSQNEFYRLEESRVYYYEFYGLDWGYFYFFWTSTQASDDPYSGAARAYVGHTNGMPLILDKEHSYRGTPDALSKGNSNPVLAIRSF